MNRPSVSLVLFGLACAIAACGLASCDRTAPVRTKPTLKITATSFALADIVRQVGGDRVEIDYLFGPGDNPAPARLADTERGRLSSAELVLAAGPRGEPWVTGDLDEALQSSRLVLLENLPRVRTVPEGGLLWLDPLIARDAAPVLADRLTRTFPEERAAFESRAAAFAAKIDELVARFPNERFGRQTVLVVGRAFEPLLDRFGVQRVVVDGRPLRLSDDELGALRRRAAAMRATTILLPVDTPTAQVRRIEARTALKAVLLDPLGGGERGDYLKLVEFNLSQLVDATTR